MKGRSRRVLVVEDEAHLADGLRFNLEAEGYAVDVVGDGEGALERLLAPDSAYDVVVLDVMLPGRDGFAVATELRNAGNFVPVLMLTARGRPEDVLNGFAAGADDYLPKPFELAILLARLRGLLRRREWAEAQSSPEVSTVRNGIGQEFEIFSFDGKTFDFGALEIRTPKQSFHLTVMEAQVLRYLIRNAGRVLPRKGLLEDVWDVHEDTDTRAIDNFIVRLRRYIEAEPARPRHLLTVRGIGYRFISEPGRKR
jgi:DNA-binding response OmpR family regulator